MEPEHIIFTLIIGQVGLLLFTWYFIVRKHQRMVYRDKIFDIRNEMFIYAAKISLPFDHPAYVHLRYLFNGAIHFSDRIDFFSLIFIRIMGRITGALGIDTAKYKARCKNAMDNIEEEGIKEALLGFKRRYVIETGKLIVTSSISCMFLLLIVLAIEIVRLAIEVGIQQVIQQFETAKNRVGSWVQSKPIIQTAETCSFTISKL